MTGAISVVHPSQFTTRLGVMECAIAGDGPPVVLLHGAMGGYDQSMLLGRAAVGTPGFRFVAISRPGYLNTPRRETPEEQANLVAALMDALGIAAAPVVAISAGGPTALQFALRHSIRCLGLIMISACSAPLKTRLPLRFHLMRLLARIPLTVKAMQKRAAAHPEEAARRSIADPEMRARTLAHREAGPMLKELQLITLDQMGRRLPGTLDDIRQTRLPFHYELERITAPVLVVHGTADQVVPFGQAKALAQRVGNAELFALQGGEHVSLFTHMDAIRAKVRPTLHAWTRECG